MSRIFPVSSQREVTITLAGRPFFLRTHTSDAFTVREVWERRVYPDPRASAIVCDIGANIGAFTVRAARGARHVFAFEPLPANFRQLAKNTHGLPNVTLFPLAIAAAEGSKHLRFHATHPGGASLVSKRGKDGEDVRTVSLARLFDLCAVPTIDFLKMDIEGAEHEVFLAAEDGVLRRFGTVVLEFHDFLPGRDFRSIQRKLEGAGFRVTVRLQHYRLTRTGVLLAEKT